MSSVVAYTHGCWNDETREYSYAYVIEKDGEVIHKAYHKGNNPDYLESKSLVGKCMAAAAAVRWCAEHGYKNVLIRCNLQGVEMWATGKWNTNQPSTQAYKAYMDKVVRESGIQFEFMHISKNDPNPFYRLARSIARKKIEAYHNIIFE